MRYIDLATLLQKRRHWGRRQELWHNETLKKDFRDYFYNKCWYTEAELIGQDAHIDHFRPKGAIRQYIDYSYNEPYSNSGYSWLKNDPSNYRVCCIYANRKTDEGGKGCYFPLADDSDRLTEGGTELETPLLIDPCNHDDVQLISFMGNQVIPTSNEQLCKVRVDVSTSIYNLHDATFMTPRARVWEDIVKTLAEYDAGYINEIACLRRLRDAVDRRAPFSACAIACVNSLSSEYLKAKLNLDL